MDILKRLGAIIVIVILIGLYVATFILGISGSDYLTGMIFLDVVIPVLCWAFWLVARLLRRKGEELRDNEQDEYTQDESDMP